MKTLFTAREIVRAFRLTLSAALIAMLAFACVSPAAAHTFADEGTYNGSVSILEASAPDVTQDEPEQGEGSG